jgi:hypothetical protein
MTGIKPSGWHNNKYEGIVDSAPPYVYNRCHLLAHSLGGKEEEKNLVTGTRYINESGMMPFESLVYDYINSTENHVLYRVTPVFEGDNKLVSGIEMEAYSVEDSGKGVCFNVFCYNVQPGIDLNYANGENSMADLFNGLNDYLPFAIYNADESNPDLILEMNKHLSIIFEDQKSSGTFSSMMDEIKSIASEARALEKNNTENAALCYVKMKTYQYKYFEV